MLHEWGSPSGGPLIIWRIMDWIRTSKRTAIKRDKLPLPSRIALERELIRGIVLNFGAGKDKLTSVEANKNKSVVACINYDINSNDTSTFSNYVFDTVMCNYVLNVLPPQERSEMIQNMKKCGNKGAKFLIAVRTDFPRKKWKKYKDGYITGSGTFQKIYNKLKITRELRKHFSTVHMVEQAGGMILMEAYI